MVFISYFLIYLTLITRFSSIYSGFEHSHLTRV